MEYPVVSVFCLAYNHEKYIRRTLEGFVNQKTNFKYEVLINDDASTDDTSSIISQYAQKYPDLIKPIYQKENVYSQGVNIVNDILKPLCHSKYVAFCEGDDYWISDNKLQLQYDALEENPDCSVAVHKVNCCNPNDTKILRVIPESKYGLDNTTVLSKDELIQLYWIKGGYPFHTSSYFVRRSVLDVDLNLKRDVGILRKALICGKAYYCDKPMSVRQLFTEGNFNNRIRNQGKQGWIKLAKDNIESDYIFDDYTMGCYHDYITYGMLNGILTILKYDKSIAKDVKSQYNIKLFNSLKCLTFKKKIKTVLGYAFLKTCPLFLINIILK